MAEPRVLQGRYRLVAPIGEGMATQVWEAVDEILTRSVAVKILQPHVAGDRELRERFRREAVSAARLAHPNVVATFDTGEDGDTVFIVMELIRGQNLARLVGSEGALPPWLAASIAAQVADALSHAHERQIVHGNVRPANILVCDADQGVSRRVKLGDFAIAGAFAADQVADEAGDVQALGHVLYEMITGRTPVAGASGRAPKPRQLRPGIPRALEVVVDRAMGVGGASGYRDAAELAAELRGIGLGPDDAVPSVVRERTPPRGVAPAFTSTERSWIVPALLIVVAAAVLVGLALTFRIPDLRSEILGGDDPEQPAPSSPVGPLVVRSFDPMGRDRSENEDRAAAAADGDPSTRWGTDTYETQEFAGLKSGVGLVIQLPSEVALRRLRVSSPSSGWEAEVYVADSPSEQLAGWGQPVATQTDAAGSADFDLDGAEGRALLLWITRLGADRKFEVAEIEVRG